MRKYSAEGALLRLWFQDRTANCDQEYGPAAYQTPNC